MTKLSDTQLIVLSSAAKHDDGLATRPANLNAAAAMKVASSLMDNGFAREIRAKADGPVWHENDDGRFALKITCVEARVASINDPYAMAIDTSQTGHDVQTVRTWAAKTLSGRAPFMLPQTRPFIIVPCMTFEDALRVAYQFSKSAFARERPWRSRIPSRGDHRTRRA